MRGGGENGSASCRRDVAITRSSSESTHSLATTGGNTDRFRAPITLGVANLVTAKIPQFMALGRVSTVVMQTERMFDVEARMVLLLI
jgi:hypothetical protein